MFILFSILLSLIILCTFVPLLRIEKWWIRGLDFPRLQLSIVTFTLFCIELFTLPLSSLNSWLLIIPTLSCFFYQTCWIYPYTKLAKPEVKTSLKKQSDAIKSSISIITANVLMTNRNARQLLNLVKQYDPDILVTLETNKWWESHLDSLSETYTYNMKCPLENLYGMHVYSRIPLSNCEVKYLIEDKVPSMHAKATLESGDEVRLHFLHPAPPSPTENEESAERDAELVVVAKDIAESCDSEQPVIVTGDMNDVAWSRTTRLFRKLSGLLDPRIGRGMFNTFHAKYWFMRWPLDHLFHSDHFTLDSITRLPSFGSDHFALYTQLSLEPKEAPNQSGINKEEEDEELAQDKIEQKNVSTKDIPKPV